ncbi:YpoC family protein [Bacillus massilinigeriensis]|uniref:YpoC family protein n=1 Tax=Bacillus mediterraneensis TaxID=1805474 RepID=UPI0008F89694|nr:hypothetical protein [Bacillus mediterraneensis]
MASRRITVLELSSPIFFPEGDIEWKEEYSEGYYPSIPFIHEAAFFANLISFRPWENREESLALLLQEWKTLIKSLKLLFAERRQKETTKEMQKAAAFFLEYLYWSNGQPVEFPLERMDRLEGKPVNVRERISFILSRPALYASFVQLEEMMREQEKQYAAIQLKNKQK